MSVNHITELICSPGSNNQFAIADTWAIDSYVSGDFNGVSGNLVNFYSDTPGSQATIDISTIGNIYVSYVSFQDIKFVGGTVYADSTCVNLGDNSGINFGGIPVISTFNIASYLNVVDFNISSISTPVLSTDFTKATLTYVGIANPTNTSVNLTAYQYSLDGGVTWSNMTACAGSNITGLTFSPTGNSYSFIWSIRNNVGSNIYNRSIQIRFDATATFGPDIIITNYKQNTVYLPKVVSILNIPVVPVFSPSYAGVVGSSLLKNAPKIVQQ